MRKENPKAAIMTLGCKVNQYESEAIAEALAENGITVVPFDADADIYIINTCTVTAESDRKGCQMIRRAAGREPKPFVAVTGCLAQTQAQRAAGISGVSYICGSRNKLSVVEKAVSFLKTGMLPEKPEISVPELTERTFETMHITRSERTRAYIKIEDGCENRCTYCAIPGARGLVTSRKPCEVISEIKRLAENGYREIVLTGIEIASYGVDFRGDPELSGYRLIDLLEEADRVPGIARIRLGSLEPTYMKPETVSRMAVLTHLAHHFHLSLQSGSDHVLRMMKRKYTEETVRKITADIREKMPDVMFTTDILTGFPGETEEDFAKTLALVRDVRFLHMHVFPYSRRKNTPADTLPGQLSNGEKNRRAAVLIAEDERIAGELYREAACNLDTVPFLAESIRDDGVLIGHTANFMEVRLADADPCFAEHKEIRTVRITGAKDTYLIGEEIR